MFSDPKFTAKWKMRNLGAPHAYWEITKQFPVAGFISLLCLAGLFGTGLLILLHGYI